MTINTNSLLNMLKPSLNEGIKDKIQSMSKDGKVEVSSLLKEKSIQTLLSSLFKDILQGSKSKLSVNQTLQNSKAMFDFKTVSSDIKDILSNPKIAQDPKLSKQIATLKSFLVDIKDMTDKSLKSNIKNSGVFLESKLLQNSKGNTELKAQQKQEIQPQTKIQTKSTTTIQSTKQETVNPKLEQQLQSLKIFSTQIKDTNTKKEQIQNTSTLMQNNTQSKSVNISSVNQAQTVQSNNIASTIKDIQVKLDDPKIQKALDNPKLSEQISSLKKFILDIKNLDVNNQKPNTKNIAKLIQSQSQKLDTSTVSELKTTLTSIKEHIDNPKIQNEPAQNKQVQTLKQFMSDIKNLDEKAQNTTTKSISANQDIRSKNEPNITTDLKASLLQINEKVDDPKIQKVLDQISYHQLLSFSSYSNSTFLPFMWDNIEDGSVSFNSNEKELFTCSIDLNLKNYGEFKSVLLLEQKNNISINLRIKSDVLKQKVQENLQVLREGINKIGLNLVSLNVLKYDDTQTKEQKAYQSNINQLSYGIDIKA